MKPVELAPRFAVLESSEFEVPVGSLGCCKRIVTRGCKLDQCLRSTIELHNTNLTTGSDIIPLEGLQNIRKSTSSVTSRALRPRARVAARNQNIRKSTSSVNNSKGMTWVAGITVGPEP